MGKLFSLQDEELDLLWWMVAEWSDKWDCAFSAISPQASPILLGEEVAQLTLESSEPPSLKAVFSRIGVGRTIKVSIPESVKACGIDQLNLLNQPGAVCSTILPVHFAVTRACETDGDNSWVSPWEKVAGINQAQSVPPLDLAIQVHRECKLMTFMASS